MKIKTKLAFLIFIFLCFLLSCSGSYIFAAIENEVKLKNSSVTGTIRSLVKVGDKLYVANGAILEKTAFSDKEWTEIKNPARLPDSAICTGIATDGINLFASFIDDDNSDIGVYYYSVGEWNIVPSSTGNDITGVFGNGTVFATSQKNSSATEETVNIYKITTSVLTKITTSTSKEPFHLLAAGGDYFSTSEGVYNSTGFVANSPKNVKAIDKTGAYFLTDGSLYKASDFTRSYTHNIKNLTDAVLVKIDGKDLLLVSSDNGGYSEIILDSGDITKSKTISAKDSGSTTSNPSQYESAVGKYPTKSIFAESGAQGYYIYLGVNDPNYARYTGLWGYYSYGKKEWNRE